MSESTYTDPKVIELSRSFVNLVAHQETTHGTHELQVGKERLKLCNEYYDIPCDVHTKAWKAVGTFFNGTFGTPTTVFADPTGKEISRLVGGASAGELTKKMNEALLKVDGEKIPQATWSSARQWNQDAEAALEKGDIRKAIDGWTRIGKLKGGRFRVMSQDGLKKVDDSGEQALKDALALENVDDKKKALKKIIEDYKGVPVAGEAKKELDQLK